MQEASKRRAAAAAIQELPEAGIIGLGSGSTTFYVVELVGDLVRSGRRLAGVCTSEATRAHAAACGIPLLADPGPWTIDIAVDGADEVSDDLDLSKGAGGALTREKIVIFAARRVVIVCDRTKRVRRLGTVRPVALEILPFGHETTMAHLTKHGPPTLRTDRSAPVRTDNGNLLVDLEVAPIDDPVTLDRALRAVPGVVETGLFVGCADIVLVGHDHRVERLARSAPGRPDVARP